MIFQFQNNSWLKLRCSEKTKKIWTILPLFIWHYLLVSNGEWKMGKILVKQIGTNIYIMNSILNGL